MRSVRCKCSNTHTPDEMTEEHSNSITAHHDGTQSNGVNWLNYVCSTSVECLVVCVLVSWVDEWDVEAKAQLRRNSNRGTLPLQARVDAQETTNESRTIMSYLLDYVLGCMCMLKQWTVSMVSSLLFFSSLGIEFHSHSWARSFFPFAFKLRLDCSNEEKNGTINRWTPSKTHETCINDGSLLYSVIRIFLLFSVRLNDTFALGWIQFYSLPTDRPDPTRPDSTTHTHNRNRRHLLHRDHTKEKQYIYIQISRRAICSRTFVLCNLWHPSLLFLSLLLPTRSESSYSEIGLHHAVILILVNVGASLTSHLFPSDAGSWDIRSGWT